MRRGGPAACRKQDRRIVIDFYDRGGRPNPNLDSEIRPLRLTEEEKKALASFLRALNGVIREDNLR
jgi:hypothetical protein